MSKHILEINRHGKQWCRIETPELGEQGVIEDALLRYPANEGFSIQLYQVSEARRFLESSPDGLKIVAIDYELEPIDLTA